MVSVDQGPMVGVANPVVWIAATIAIGWVITLLTYKKVSSVKPRGAKERVVMRGLLEVSLSMTLLFGCRAPQRFAALPEDLDRHAVPHQTVEMMARRYEFAPEVVRVKAGTLVTLEITALDATHGFALDAFGIDETIDKGQKREVEFYAAEKGEYGFHCSYFCGIGHPWMNGKLVVE